MDNPASSIHARKKNSENSPVVGLVETSNNLAAVLLDGTDKYKIIMSSRSSIWSALEAQQEIIARAAKSVGAKVVQEDAYPGNSLFFSKCLPSVKVLRGFKLLFSRYLLTYMTIES